MALTDVVQGLGTSQALLTVVSLALGAFAAYLYVARSLPEGAPPLVKGDWPLIGPTTYWTERWNFFQEAIKASLNGTFTFHVGKHVVVGMSGDENRRVFMESKQLDFSSG
jgi:hypothetical protein